MKRGYRTSERPKRRQGSEERYRSFFEVSKDALCIADRDGRIIDVNESASALLGYSREEMVKISIQEVCSRPIEWQGLKRELESGGYVKNFPVRLAKKDGTEVDYFFTVTAKCTNGGGIGECQCVIHEIAEHDREVEALRESERRYRLMAGNVTDVIWTIDTNLILSYISPSITRLRGYTVEETMGQRLEEIFTPASLEVALKLVEEELSKRNTEQKGPVRLGAVGLEMTCRDGSTVWTESRVTLMYSQDGWPAGMMGVTRDVTERHRMEEALRESEKRYRLLAENVTDVIWVTDMNLRHVYLSPSARRLRGFEIEECLAQTFEEMLTPASYEVARRAFERQLAIEKKRKRDPFRSWVLQLEVRCKDGSTVWTEDKVTFLRDSEQRPVRFLGVTRDITERKQAEDALRALSRRLVEVQEVERRQIARELHDEIGQALTGLKLLLETAARMPARNLGSYLGEAQAMINKLMALVQNLSLDLRPAMLDDLGLIPALLWHFERYTAQTGVRVIFKHKGLEGRLTSEIETAVYRIIQEGLTNIARHAGVSEATVRLVANQDVLSVQIEDRGAGFDSEVALASGTSSGLNGMQERAVLLGGEFKIKSTPGAGTRLTARFPIGLG